MRALVPVWCCWCWWLCWCKDAFRIGPPGAHTENNVPFEHNVLYRRHLDPKKHKYFPFYEFVASCKRLIS